MSIKTGYQLADAQQMMTLSTFAYAEEDYGSYTGIFNAISNYLNNQQCTYATGTNWKLVWLGITEDFENLMYVAQSTTDSNTIALAIRGTDPYDWDDITEDANVFLTTVFTYTYPSKNDNIVVSNGSLEGLGYLLGMPGYTNDNSSGNDASIQIQEFLTDLFATGMNQQNPVNIYVTGHSLGGALASVLSSWLIFNYETLGLNNFSTTNLLAYTFASPSVGNQGYADYYNGPTPFENLTFQGYNVYNSFDLVPDFCSSLGAITSNGWPWGWGGEAIINTGVGAVNLILGAVETADYVQVGTLVQLPLNADYTTPADWESIINSFPYITTIETPYEVDDWMSTNHVCNTYLNLLDAPIVVDMTSKSISHRLQKRQPVN